MTYFERIITRSRKIILADKTAGEVDWTSDTRGLDEVSERSDVCEVNERCGSGEARGSAGVCGTDDVCETDLVCEPGGSRTSAEAELNASQFGAGSSLFETVRRPCNLSIKSVIGLIGEEETEIEREYEGGDKEALSVSSVSDSDVLNSSVLNGVDVDTVLCAKTASADCKSANSSATAVSSGLPDVASFSKSRERGQSKVDTSEETRFFAGERCRPETDIFLTDRDVGQDATLHPNVKPALGPISPDSRKESREGNGISDALNDNAAAHMDPDDYLFNSEHPPQSIDILPESISSVIQQFQQESRAGVQKQYRASEQPVSSAEDQPVCIERVSVKVVPAEPDELMDRHAVQRENAFDSSVFNISRSFMGEYNGIAKIRSFRSCFSFAESA